MKILGNFSWVWGILSLDFCVCLAHPDVNGQEKN